MNTTRDIISTIEIIVEELLEISDIDIEKGFFDIGMSSLTIFTFCEKINAEYKLDCDESIIFSYPNVKELSEYIYRILE